MHNPNFRKSRILPATLLVVAGLALTACSSGSSSGTTPSASATSPTASPTASAAPSTSASAQPTSGAAAVAAIKANWAAFFSSKTPITRRLALLQDGQQFAPVIDAQAKQPLAQSATSKATAVTLTGTSQASVTYDILVGGKPALSGQHGTAVYQNGAWKVGISSFCGLLKLENNGSTTGLPAACKG
ncbi:MAG: hypothetical protein ACYCO9_06920 [Streptosporangiaceae bacterium]